MASDKQKTFPKCPYCGTEDRGKMFGKNCEKLTNLAINGCHDKEIFTCESCGKQYEVTIHIRYYARKVKEK